MSAVIPGAGTNRRIARRIRVIVADEDAEIAFGLDDLVGAYWDIVHTATEAGTIRELRVGGADVLVVAYDLGGLPGPAIADAARSVYPEPAVVIVTDDHSPSREAEARRAGVLAYEPKPVDASRLLRILMGFVNARRRLAAGRTSG